VNNAIFKKSPTFYEAQGVRKFGYWVSETKKKPHQELEELAFAGSAKGLMKAFNHYGFDATLFVIFCTGGIDFVGGYSYYNFLKGNILGAGEKGERLGEIKMKEKTGEEVHEMLFQKGAMKTPGYWKDIVAYY